MYRLGWLGIKKVGKGKTLVIVEFFDEVPDRRSSTRHYTLNQNQVFSEYILQIALNNLSMLVCYCKSTRIIGKGRKNDFLKT